LNPARWRSATGAGPPPPAWRRSASPRASETWSAAGRLDEAEAQFDEAEAIHVRLGAAFMAERTRVELALMRV
jgi:hypothetical protein